MCTCRSDTGGGGEQGRSEEREYPSFFPRLAGVSVKTRAIIRPSAVAIRAVALRFSLLGWSGETRVLAGSGRLIFPNMGARFRGGGLRDGVPHLTDAEDRR